MSPRVTSSTFWPTTSRLTLLVVASVITSCAPKGGPVQPRPLATDCLVRDPPWPYGTVGLRLQRDAGMTEAFHRGYDVRSPFTEKIWQPHRGVVLVPRPTCETRSC